MDCKHAEQLLPAFLDDTIADDDAVVVRAHLDGCAACRESLSELEVLETALLSRREMVPNPARFIAGALGSQRSSRFEWLDALVGWPALASLCLVIFGVVSLIHLDRLNGVVNALDTVKVPDVLSGPLRVLSDAVGLFAHADAGTMISIYGVLAVIVVMSTGLMAVRMLRH